jgi:hypothetical protein
MRLATEFETAANIKRTAIQARRVIESLHKELTGEDLPSKPLADFVADWLKNKERETSRSTLHAYKTVADKLLAFLGDKAALDVALISQDDLMRFRNDAFSNRHFQHGQQCDQDRAHDLQGRASQASHHGKPG